MGKTTVVIDDNLINTALQVTQLKTKKAVIEEGLREIIRKKNREILRKELGTFDLDITLESLYKDREDEGNS